MTYWLGVAISVGIPLLAVWLVPRIPLCDRCDAVFGLRGYGPHRLCRRHAQRLPLDHGVL